MQVAESVKVGFTERERARLRVTYLFVTGPGRLKHAQFTVIGNTRGRA